MEQGNKLKHLSVHKTGINISFSSYFRQRTMENYDSFFNRQKMPKKKVSEQGNLEGLVCEANQSREKSYEIQSLMSLLPRN